MYVCMYVGNLKKAFLPSRYAQNRARDEHYLMLIEFPPPPRGYRASPKRELNQTRTYEMRGGEASDLEPKRCAALAICSGLSFFFFANGISVRVPPCVVMGWSSG